MAIRLRIARYFLGSTNVLSPEELKRFVHLFVSGLTFIPRKVNSGNWSLQVCSKRRHLVWGREVIEDTTCLMNITDKILLALKFELKQKYSASKILNKKMEV